MKLLIVIVQDVDANFLLDALMEKDYRITKLATTGGFLKRGNTTLLLGVEEEKLDDVMDIIEKNCKKRTTTTTIQNPALETGVFQTIPMQINVGGAVVFMVDVEKYIRL